jgi:hypothetical protein
MTTMTGIIAEGIRDSRIPAVVHAQAGAHKRKLKPKPEAAGQAAIGNEVNRQDRTGVCHQDTTKGLTH